MKENEIDKWNKLLRSFSAESSEIERQISSATIVNIEYSPSGVFLAFSIEDAPPDTQLEQVDNHAIHGVKVISPQLKGDASAILHFSFGKIDYLEVVSNDGEDFSKVISLDFSIEKQ
ncbi:hypothetical protein [Chitiniphilus eburneus]|uniref:Uncharacterized protein n=1 Tax=Chitiniphilus eburneus TaxID=2571148 RepID=A0A4U0Q4W3_9NEIS|nr:hypothetical protein [Chitiniphilus eburneus]TJZ76193.1 hypothetical protein FAZ21_05300 [Chitiniphilus eburneus]